MNEKPIVSIIIPCFNYGRFIADAIASVEKCDSRLYELIIVDDGSTDPYTQEVLKILDKKGYNIITQENKGVSSARNLGIASSQGKYILPLDADDEIYPSYLESAVNLMEENYELGVVYGRAEFFGAKQGEWRLPFFEIRKLLIFNYIYASAIYRKNVWTECGGYDPDSIIDGWGDWDFWIAAAENGWKFAQLNELVFRYRIHEASKMEPYRTRDEVPFAIQQYVMCKHADFYRKHIIKMYNSAERLEHWKDNPLRGIARLSILKLKKLLNFEN